MWIYKLTGPQNSFHLTRCIRDLPGKVRVAFCSHIELKLKNKWEIKNKRGEIKGCSDARALPLERTVGSVISVHVREPVKNVLADFVR